MRRAHRALVLPLVCAVVGFFLTTSSVSPRTSIDRDAWSAIDRTPPNVDIASGFLRAAAPLEVQRRTASLGSDALGHATTFAADYVAERTVTGTRRETWTASFIARGYDATAPPRRSI